MEITKEIKDYIDAEVKKQLEQAQIKKNTPRLLNATHSKWFRGTNGTSSDSRMGQVFDHDGVRTYRIWDCMRPILTAICGKAYVRQISTDDEQFINDVADRMCQLIYEARLEFKEIQKSDV